jgi:hypothetical protein
MKRRDGTTTAVFAAAVLLLPPGPARSPAPARWAVT